MADLLRAPDRAQDKIGVIAVRGRDVKRRDDALVAEEPMEIRAAGPDQEPVSVAVTMRTPGDDEELATGFLYTEGLIGPDDVAGFAYGDPRDMSHPDNVIVVRLRRRFDSESVASRNFVANASCGLCGKTTLEQVELRCPTVGPGPTIERATIAGLPDAMRAAQRVFATTGGLHASGLFTPDGQALAVREDIGRHNALDKLVGWAVGAGAVPLHDRVLVVSGRVSFEIAQKAAMAAIPILCAVSAPSDLAVRAAERLGLTLVGFLRGEGFNVYAHPERIAGLA